MKAKENIMHMGKKNYIKMSLFYQKEMITLKQMCVLLQLQKLKYNCNLQP